MTTASAPLPLPPTERHISDLLWRIEHAEALLGGLEADARIVRRELVTARAALADVARLTLCHANSNSKEVPCNNTKM